MTSRRELDADLDALTSWIMERSTSFPPLQIVGAEAYPGIDADGNSRIFVTLLLRPPVDDGPWSTTALLGFYEAVDGWAHDRGYRLGPHVHLRNAALADTA